MTSGMVALHDGSVGMQVTETDVPEATPGSVVLRVHAAGVCGSDLYYYGVRTEPESYPGGHEVAAEVIAVGEGVDRRLGVGDRVAPEMVGLVRACMKCWFCRSGNYVKCERQVPRPGGGFAQHMKVPAHACFKFPGSMTWQEGAMIEPLAVSLHGVRRAEVQAYETAVVLGSGTIGLMAVAALRAMGTRRIIATARHPHQARMAERLGAEIVVQAEDEQPWLDAAGMAHDRMSDSAIPSVGSPLWDTIASVTEGRGADVVFECVGGTSGGSLNQAIAISRKGGRVVSVGAPKVLVPVNVIIMLRREISLILSHCYSVIDGRHDYEVAIDLIALGAAPVADLVTHTYPLSDINKAFECAQSKESGSLKVQVLP